MDPRFTNQNITTQGVCGYKFGVQRSTWEHPFTLTPSVPADLDIFFYGSNGSILPDGQIAQCGTGPVSTGIPKDSAYAIVVLSDVSICPLVGYARVGTETGVAFTYTAN
jgi:hypothetical protein